MQHRHGNSRTMTERYNMRDFFEHLRLYVQETGADEWGQKSAYIIGGGMTGLAVAVFLINETKMQGYHVHILEKETLPGGISGKDANLYDSLILPVVRYLQQRELRFHYDTTVTGVQFYTKDTMRFAGRIELTNFGKTNVIDLTELDFVFSTVGSDIDAMNYASIRKTSGSSAEKILQACATKYAESQVMAI